ncbi:MAG: LuxR C-terminal-related transcriptional regulator [Chloroflexota bacterium]
MSAPLLRTKLFIPTLRTSLVPRQRLINRLGTGLNRKLTLVSAPAGFGKTTLVTSWLANIEQAVAWLSLDEGDSEPINFLTYLIAAIQTIAEQVEPSGSADNIIGDQALKLLQSTQSAQPRTIVTALLNEIAELATQFLLVLDDYHLIDSPEVDEALAFLLDHLPPQMHLVITTREDPNLPLARLRVRHQLTEVRAADLRFTIDEVKAFLKDVMDIDLLDADIDALETRTEGWAAGLQMAALSIQGNADPSQFIRTFTGSNRFVIDYLMEEVLRQQSDEVRTFLLQTSILDRLCVSLCNSVTGQQNSEEILDSLERANLFIIPIDDQRQWYRYHHLFAEVLQARLLKEQSAPNTNDLVNMPQLHQLASVWYAEHELIPQAIHHTLAAQNFERAAELIAQVWRAYDRSNQNAQVRIWLDALPEALIESRADLCAAYAWRLFYLGDFEGGESWLTKAESLEHTPAKGAIPLPAIIAGARAYLAQARGDFSGSIHFAQRSLELLPADDYVERAIAASLLGLASWAEGDLETTYQAISDVQNGFRKGGEDNDANEMGYILADVRRAQGRLRLAKEGYEQTIKFVQAIVESGRSAPRGMASFYMGLGEIHCEMGDLTEAKVALEKSEVLGPSTGLEDWQHRFCMAQARCRAIHGDLEDALTLLDEAEKVFYQSPLPNVRPIPALKARIWIRQGRLSEAQDWVSSCGLSVADELSYLREFEQVTLARLLIEQAKIEQNKASFDEAIDYLGRLQQFAASGRRLGREIEIRILQSIAHEAQSDHAAASTALKDALSLAEPEGYVPLFADEGLPLAALLKTLAKQSIMPDYVNRLLAAFDAQGNIDTRESQLTSDAQPQFLIEPLSDRELEILQLIAAGKKNQEIADELIISLNTVRYHTKNIFGKLGVNKRTQAVAQAQALGLL